MDLLNVIVVGPISCQTVSSASTSGVGHIFSLYSHIADLCACTHIHRRAPKSFPLANIYLNNIKQGHMNINQKQTKPIPRWSWPTRSPSSISSPCLSPKNICSQFYTKWLHFVRPIPLSLRKMEKKEEPTRFPSSVVGLHFCLPNRTP